MQSMNLKFSSFFVCFFINISFGLCHSTVSNNESADSFTHDPKDLSYKDAFNLHHAFVIEKLKWESGMISFKIDKNFDSDEIYQIYSAMYEIENSSCIRFTAHNPIHGPNYVMIRKDFYDTRRCGWANVGCLNVGEQTLSITSGCVNSSLHELLHTIGFNHHQKRSDRDQYIAIHKENTNCTTEEFFVDFEKEIEFDRRIEYLTPFDYESVMLYKENSFSTNDNPVITTKINGVKIQPSERTLSKYDKVLLNRFYDCETVDKKKSKIFYENEFGLSYPPIVNYHEIERAKNYFTGNKMEKVNEENEKSGDDVVNSEQFPNNTSDFGQNESDPRNEDNYNDEYEYDDSFDPLASIQSETDPHNEGTNDGEEGDYDDSFDPLSYVNESEQTQKSFDPLAFIQSETDPHNEGTNDGEEGDYDDSFDPLAFIQSETDPHNEGTNDGEEGDYDDSFDPLSYVNESEQTQKSFDPLAFIQSETDPHNEGTNDGEEGDYDDSFDPLSYIKIYESKQAQKSTLTSSLAQSESDRDDKENLVETSEEQGISKSIKVRSKRTTDDSNEESLKSRHEARRIRIQRKVQIRSMRKNNIDYW